MFPALIFIHSFRSSRHCKFYHISANDFKYFVFRLKDNEVQREKNSMRIVHHTT